jgi:hypothetical protein
MKKNEKNQARAVAYLHHSVDECLVEAVGRCHHHVQGRVLKGQTTRPRQRIQQIEGTISLRLLLYP